MSDSVTVKRLPKNRVVATIIFDETQYAPAETEALSRFAQHVKIDGFRAGNAPTDMVRSKVNPDDLFEETVRILLRTALPSLADEHKIAPVVPPKVEVTSRMPVTLNVTFVEKPEVTIKKPDDISVPKKEMKVEQKDIDNVIKSVLREQRTLTPVDRAAKNGDALTIDFHAKDEQGNNIDGLHAHDYEAELGSKTLLPGFEEALVGARAGEKKTFTLTLPEKFPAAELAGKKATFDVDVKTVQEAYLPELTDEFAKTHLQAESADAFKKMVEDSIRSQDEQFARMERERNLLDEIRKRTTVEIADELLDEEVRGMIEEWAEQLQKQGKTIAQALEQQKKSAEQVEKEMRQQAEDRWKLRLGMAKLIELRSITVSPEELEEAFKVFLERLPDDQRSDATAQWQSRGTMFEEIRWRTMVDKLIEQLLAA